MFAHELTIGQSFRTENSNDVFTVIPRNQATNGWERASGIIGRAADGRHCSLSPMSMVFLATLPNVEKPIQFHDTDSSFGIGGIPDTDSGLGIGGINNDQTIPFVPSARAIERVQRMHDTDTVCRCCGASKNFDGAMFTTFRGGDICDDCV